VYPILHEYGSKSTRNSYFTSVRVMVTALALVLNRVLQILPNFRPAWQSEAASMHFCGTVLPPAFPPDWKPMSSRMARTGTCHESCIRHNLHSKQLGRLHLHPECCCPFCKLRMIVHCCHTNSPQLRAHQCTPHTRCRMLVGPHVPSARHSACHSICSRCGGMLRVNPLHTCSHLHSHHTRWPNAGNLTIQPRKLTSDLHYLVVSCARAYQKFLWCPRRAQACRLHLRNCQQWPLHL
jgi:hypothetical protein